VWCMLLTRAGGAVLHLTKKIKGMAVTCPHDGEAKASVEASIRIDYARTVEAALGVPPTEPTLLITDSLSNQRVAMNAGSAANSRHLLIIYEAMMTRVALGQIVVAHVFDPENASDFLSKPTSMLTAQKFEASVAYAAGSIRRLRATCDTKLVPTANMNKCRDEQRTRIGADGQNEKTSR
jgi:hypothetical protein